MSNKTSATQVKEQVPQQGDKVEVGSETFKRMFLDVPNAAELAGFSVRHFRRIILEYNIRIVQIGRKFFILRTDFERCQLRNSRSDGQLGQSLDIHRGESGTGSKIPDRTELEGFDIFRELFPKCLENDPQSLSFRHLPAFRPEDDIPELQPVRKKSKGSTDQEEQCKIITDALKEITDRAKQRKAKAEYKGPKDEEIEDGDPSDFDPDAPLPPFKGRIVLRGEQFRKEKPVATKSKSNRPNGSL